MRAAPTTSLQLNLVRMSERGQQRALSDAQIERDPIAHQAADTVRAFDRFLASHDAPARARIPDGFRIALIAGENNATGGSRGLDLGAGRAAFPRHSARSTEIVAHELVHAVSDFVGSRSSVATEEGWADVVGNAFARQHGTAGADDWKVGEGAVTKQFAPNGYIRDLAHRRIATVPQLTSYVNNLGHGVFEIHEASGVLTTAATIAAQSTSPHTVGAIYTNALLHDLGPRTRATVPHSYARAAKTERETGKWPTERIFLAELRASARATLDAASRLHGRDSHEFASNRDSWDAVGLDVDWSPRQHQQS